MKAGIFFFLIGFLPFLVNAQKKSFPEKILPDHAVIQYAGNIGFLSAGIGYESKNRKFNGEVLYGYLPESIGGIQIHSVTGKISWLPLNRLYNDFSVDYIIAGLYLNYVFGNQYFAFSPSYYPFHYYDFPTALSAGISIGQQVNKGRLSFYYELGTTDKELVSYLGNVRSVEFSDILSLGIGLRISLK
jgi:hypothetical protein